MITILDNTCNHISQNQNDFFISQDSYDSLLNSVQLHQLTCSCGHASCLSIHGYYKRTVKVKGIAIKLRICRVKCAVCGATHALLPSSIVPYSQIPLSDHHKVCLALENNTSAITVCESNPLIDENNLKSIRRSYRKHWKEKLKSLQILLSPVTSLIISCFANYCASFMQIHRGYNSLFAPST